MPRALKTCSTSGCPEIVASGRCPTCQAQAERRRGSAAQRGYGGRGHRGFRTAVLRRDPLCVCTDQAHGHGPQCLAISRHADHWPLDRDELIRRGLNPNDPARGRGLCHPCHSKRTAHDQPGGWNAR